MNIRYQFDVRTRYLKLEVEEFFSVSHLTVSRMWISLIITTGVYTIGFLLQNHVFKPTPTSQNSLKRKKEKGKRKRGKGRKGKRKKERGNGKREREKGKEKGERGKWKSKK